MARGAHKRAHKRTHALRSHGSAALSAETVFFNFSRRFPGGVVDASHDAEFTVTNAVVASGVLTLVVRPDASLAPLQVCLVVQGRARRGEEWTLEAVEANVTFVADAVMAGEQPMPAVAANATHVLVAKQVFEAERGAASRGAAGDEPARTGGDGDEVDAAAFPPSPYLPARRRRLLDTFSDSLWFVNRQYDRRYGTEARRVIEHMPHLIDTRVVEEMQAE